MPTQREELEALRERAELERLRALSQQQPQAADMDVPTPENLELSAQNLRPGQKLSIGDRIGGGLETAMSVAGGAITEPVAGLAGIAAAANPFNEAGAGAQRAEQVRQAGQELFSPVTQSGQQGIDALGEAVGVVAEPIDEFVKAGSQRAYEETGSPLVGTAFEMLPAITGTLVGRFSSGSNKFKAENAGKVRSAIAQEIINGDVNVGNIAKTLDADGKLITNPNMKRAVELMGKGDDAYNAAVTFEKMNDATRVAANKMLDKIEANKKSGDMVEIMNNRPALVLGESLAKRVNRLNQFKVSASKEIGRLINGPLGAKNIDTSPMLSKLVNELKEIDVTVSMNDAGKLVADTSSSMKNIGESIGAGNLNIILQKLQAGKMTAKDIHNLKKDARRKVNYDATGTKPKADFEVESIIKSLTSDMGDSISNVSKGYAKQNKIFSDSIGDLNKADKMLGNTLMIGDDLVDSKMGALAKRIGTNLASRDDIKSFVTSIDESLAKQGFKFKDDLERQVAVLAEIEKLFKIEASQAPFGFTSRIAQGAAEVALPGGGGAVDATMRAVVDAFRNMNKMEFDDKMKALRAMSKPKSKGAR